MVFNWDDVLKLGLALLLGGAVGAEREYRDKAAGLRTITFICVGATLFTMLSRRLSATGDPGRIAANIVSGVGFLGAGSILHQRGVVKGLTTAATVWLVAAIGMAVGSDQVGLALCASVIALIVLAVLPSVERMMARGHYGRIYEVTCPLRPDLVEELREHIEASKLRIHTQKVTKSGKTMKCRWALSGRTASHRALQQVLLAREDVIEFTT
jgi:putative Mg2+ transporter-C (MgtC) family protein